jgi:hypothetical protein
MAEISLEDLHGYLDEALNAQDTARIEQALRQSASLRQILYRLMQERDRGDHTVGAIWRRNRLSCPTREQLGSYSLGVLEEGLQDYIHFHLQTIGCPYCLANLNDLESRKREPAAQAQKRRKKLFESSAGYLRGMKR